MNLQQFKHVDANISVVIPVRNRIMELNRALQSIRSQRAVPTEVIIVNDASDDETSEFLAGLECGQIRIIHSNRHIGAAAARNLGVKHSTTPHVAFLDSDDQWLPDCISSHLDALSRAEISICGMLVRRNSKNLKVTQQKDTSQTLKSRLLELRHKPISSSCLAIKSEATSNVCFDETLPALQDFDWLLNASCNSEVAISCRALILKHSGTNDRIYSGGRVIDARRMVFNKWRREIELQPNGVLRWRLAAVRDAAMFGELSDLDQAVEELRANHRRLAPKVLDSVHVGQGSWSLLARTLLAIT
jgi:glycosyltransferase involved in cell wall biosynthesis